MKVYDSLTADERDCVEYALHELRDALKEFGVQLANDDRAAKAAEALAVYVRESMT